MPAIPVVGRLRQENCKVEDSLGCMHNETLSQK
jgi:hypothetical protein